MFTRIYIFCIKKLIFAIKDDRFTVFCISMQPLLHANIDLHFGTAAVQVKGSFLQPLWFNTFLGYNGKIAHRKIIKVRSTIKLEICWNLMSGPTNDPQYGT